MKSVFKILSAAVVLAVIFSLFSCSWKENEEALLLSRECYAASGEKQNEELYYYNSSNQNVRVEFWYKDEITSKTELRYDENGYKNYESAKTNSRSYTIHTVNDKNGKILKTTTDLYKSMGIDEYVTEYEYIDENGSYKTIGMGIGGGAEIVTVYYMDDRGNLTRVVQPDGSELIHENTYENDLLTEVKTKNNRKVYEYDEDGNLITETVYNGESLVAVYKYKYSNLPPKYENSGE